MAPDMFKGTGTAMAVFFGVLIAAAFLLGGHCGSSCSHRLHVSIEAFALANSIRGAEDAPTLVDEMLREGEG